MSTTRPAITLEKLRRDIAKKVRELRQERHFTQAELSQQLGLSQSRLSEIENGSGSFTAEQLLLILQLFNVTVGELAPKKRQKPDRALQNALARLGAAQLQESPDALPSERLQAALDVVREALITAESPRHLTALAPVLVRNIDRINLKKLDQQLAAAGLERRLAWLIDNTLWAVRQTRGQKPPRPWAQLYRRTEVVLTMFLELLSIKERNHLQVPGTLFQDILDSDIRSRKTLERVMACASEISRRWGIASSLQPEDFLEALRAARAGA